MVVEQTWRAKARLPQRRQQSGLFTGDDLFRYVANFALAACGEEAARLNDCKRCPEGAAVDNKCPARTAPHATRRMIAAKNI